MDRENSKHEANQEPSKDFPRLDADEPTTKSPVPNYSTWVCVYPRRELTHKHNAQRRPCTSKGCLALARDGATYGSFVEKELDVAPGTYTKYSRTSARSQSPRHHQEEEIQQKEEGPQIFQYNPNSDLEYGEQENEFAIENGFWNLVAELQGLNQAEPFVPEPRAE
jgi:hypothetical protein